jgi:hypothetical protein
MEHEKEHHHAEAFPPILDEAFSTFQEMAETRKHSLGRPVLHSVNFDPVVLIRISFENDIDLSFPFRIGHINRGPRRLAMGILIRPVLFAIVWYSYLTKSKRVQATYSRDYSVVTKRL